MSIMRPGAYWQDVSENIEASMAQGKTRSEAVRDAMSHAAQFKAKYGDHDYAPQHKAEKMKREPVTLLANANTLPDFALRFPYSNWW